MATLKGGLQIEGNIKGLSFYTRRDSDKIIVRSKGGASKQKIRRSPSFEKLRLQQNEWRGCTAFASKLRYAFGGLHRVADYNLTPALNAFAKNIQKTDEENETGTRSICFSKWQYTLDGFNFNRNYPFNTVLRVAPVVSIDREALRFGVKIPRINTEVDLVNLQRLPYFRLLVSVGIVSDLTYSPDTKAYCPMNDRLHGSCRLHNGEWLVSENMLAEQFIEIKFPDEVKSIVTDDVTFVVSMAIEFGKVGFTGQPQPVKYAGCGKVLACG